MKSKKGLLACMLIIIIGSFCIACGNKGTDKVESQVETEKIQETNTQEKEDSEEIMENDMQENLEEVAEETVEEITLNNSYKTKFSEVNAVTYPTFVFDYTDKWVISQEEVTQTGETVTLENENGITIKFSHIGGVAEGQLRGGSATDMTRVDISKIADSSFEPGYVQATDYSYLGKFMVAKIKVTGQLDALVDSDFKDVDGAISYAVLPETMLGTKDDVNGAFEGEFAFWYSDYISVIASSPSGKFSEAEAYEIQMILSSFRTE